MFYTDVWGLQPGVQPPAETYESAFRWGPAGLGLITGGTISSTAQDPGNSPTYELRPGLVLAQLTADGTWTDYDKAAADGSEVAAGVLLTSIRMQNILTGANQPRFYGVLVGGPVKASSLLGLDLNARNSMSDHFWFDDPLMFSGNHWFPWRRFQSKTANYVITAADNFTHFDHFGATANITFTLPPIQNGLCFGFHARNANLTYTFTVTSAEGNNMLIFNDVAASSVILAGAGAIVGGGFRIYSNGAGTLWIVENTSAGANVITSTT